VVVVVIVLVVVLGVLVQVVVVVVVMMVMVVVVVVAKFLSVVSLARIYLQQNSPERCLRARLRSHNWKM